MAASGIARGVRGEELCNVECKCFSRRGGRCIVAEPSAPTP